WKGFEIHPETPPDGSDLASLGFDEATAGAIHSHVRKLSEEAGLKLNLPSRISNSRLALQIAEFAKEKGKFKEYHEAVFRAYWQEAKDIGDREQLFSLAAEVGLDLEELEAYLESGKAADRLNQHLQEVRENGISGVPTFVIGDKMVVGAQPYEQIRSVVKDVLTGVGDRQ
ncbi:MAG: DsbA family protein, partial [Candidatus Marinimicrobia bacterium]|nr:DsbA family protein [Candidatus Neomarinimicrobiota bacterium]